MEQWKTAKLSGIALVVKGKQINKKDICENGKYYHLNGGVSPSNYTNIYNTDENTISISEGGNSCGFVKWNKEKFFSGGHNYTIKEISNGILDKYLYYYLKYSEKYIMKLRVGSGLPNIQKKDLENVEIFFPEDINIQKDIVSILEKIDEIITINEKREDNIQKEKEYYIKKIFDQNILNIREKRKDKGFNDI